MKKIPKSWKDYYTFEILGHYETIAGFVHLRLSIDDVLSAGVMLNRKMCEQFLNVLLKLDLYSDSSNEQ